MSRAKDFLNFSHFRVVFFPRLKLCNVCLMVNFFYGGVDSQSKQALDLASKGSFMGSEVSEAWNLTDRIQHNAKNWYLGSKENTKVSYL